MKNRMPPVHPGEILRELYLEPLGMSQNELARRLNVSPRRINEIVNGRRGITADTAMRLARFFKITPQYWMGLQGDYDLETAQESLEKKIEAEVTPCEKCACVQC